MADIDLGTIGFTSTSTLSAGAPSPGTDLGVDMYVTARLVVRLDNPYVGDTFTKVKGYRIVAVDKYGQPEAEVENAEISGIRWSINQKGGFSFTVAANDPKVTDFRAPEQEVQLWRGGRLLNWFVITKARANIDTVEFSCKTLDWYFDRRLVGAVPRTGVFRGTHLEYRAGAWVPASLPGTKPRRYPVRSLSTEQTIADGKSLALSASGGREIRTRSADTWFTTANGDILSATGETQLTNIIGETFSDAPTFSVNVYHDNTEGDDAKSITQQRWDSIRDFAQTVKPDIKVIGKGYGDRHPIETNATSAGRTANRRVQMTFRDSAVETSHGQYVHLTYDITVPTSSAHRLKVVFRAWVFIEEFEAPAVSNYGLVLERQDPTKPHKNPAWAAEGYKKVYERRFITISKHSPRGRWIRMEASMKVPNDGKPYVLEGRLFPPSGLAYFDEADLYLDESLDYQNEEQARIMRALIDHAQDETLGKSDLNIGRRIPKTEVNRTRRYYFGERTVIGEHLMEFSQMGDGIEWDIQTTRTTRTLVGYYPRKERKTGYVLALGSNVVSADVEVDGEATSNVVVVMANEVEAHAREERAQRDDSLMDTTFEIAYMATPGSSVSSLNGQAKRGLERYRKPVTIPSLRTNPAFVDEILENVRTGDVVLVDVRAGWFQTQTEYRVLDMELDPSSEQVGITLQPEDTPIKVLAGFGSTWRYFNQAQTNSTGASNNKPKETNKTWAGTDYDDSAWSVGTAGFGWYDDGSVVSQAPTVVPATTIPQNHEVWMRKTIACTEEMYVTVRADQFAYIYVNGVLLTDTYRVGHNFNSRFIGKALRVPSEVLNPNGQQVVTVHVQDRLNEPSTHPRALYADAKIRGIYNPAHVEG